VRKKQRRLIISTIGILSLVLIFCVQIIFSVLNCEREKSTLPRLPKTLTNFEPTWFLDDVYLHKTQNGVNLVASGEKLVMYGTLSRCGYDRLISLSAINGKIIAQSASGLPIPWNTGIHHIAYNATYLYLGYDGARSTPSGVIAYEIDTNTVVWEQPIPIDSGSQIGSLIVDETMLGVGTTRYFLLDVSTGEIIHERKEFLLNSFGLYAFWYAAVNPQSDSSTLDFWDDLTPEIYQPPLLTNGNIVIRTARGWRTFGKVRVFDRQTNSLLWETDEDVISNVAIDRVHAYFLTSAAELVATDIQTGQVVGKIEFNSENLEPQDDRGFFIAASDNNVFVYFGDSRRLFAFRFLPAE
jgi:outer membrane protein assembly factor BamB